MNYQSLFFLCLLTIMSCKTPSDSQNGASSEQASLMLTISKGPCFGQCPMYKMNINTDGVLSYKGIRFTDKQGVYAKRLSSDRLEALNRSIKKANLWNKEAKYSSGLSDMQKITLEYFEDGKSKKIEGDGNAIPADLQALIQNLDLIANSKGWEMIEKPENDTSKNPTIIQDEIIVQLKSSVKLEEWLNGFKAYGLAHKKNISPSLNMWLLQYDTSKVAAQELLAKIKAADGVVNAEFNKNLNQRN